MPRKKIVAMLDVSTTNVLVKKRLVVARRFFVQHPCAKTFGGRHAFLW
jgi:hypothetical protein